MPSKISRLTDCKFLWVVKCQIEGINHRKTLGAQVVGSKVASSAVSTCKVPGASNSSYHYEPAFSSNAGRNPWLTQNPRETQQRSRIQERLHRGSCSEHTAEVCQGSGTGWGRVVILVLTKSSKCCNRGSVTLHSTPCSPPRLKHQRRSTKGALSFTVPRTKVWAGSRAAEGEGEWRQLFKGSLREFSSLSHPTP